MRTVSELMQLGTYQGMTDEEIDSLFEHVIFNARLDGRRMAESSARTLQTQEMHEARVAQLRASADALAQQTATPLVLQEVRFDV